MSDLDERLNKVIDWGRSAFGIDMIELATDAKAEIERLRADTFTMLSEQYRLAAKEWCQLDAAANLLEESKSAVLSQMISRQLIPDMPHNRAEMNAKASTEWSEYITKMVKAREEANLAKINVKYIEMKFSEQQSAEATARAESRL